MTGRERIIRTLAFEEPDRIPHFEVMFELEHEAFGRRFPEISEWGGYSSAEKERAIESCMDIYELIVGRYQWDGLVVFYPWCDPLGVAAAKRRFGDDIFIGGIVGGSVWSIESLSYGNFEGVGWEDFSVMLAEDPERLHRIADQKAQSAIEKIKPLLDAGADFVHIVNDVAFNGGPFVSPEHFSRLVTPYLRRQVDYIRSQGAYAFVHSDGDIGPVMDDYLSLNANCFQSVDPMAGMDIAAVKKRTSGRLALMGNVQCSFLQDGPKDAIRRSALYCLENASRGGGYIFGTSNTIFKGMPLENYEYMLSVYRDFCRDQGAG